MPTFVIIVTLISLQQVNSLEEFITKYLSHETLVIISSNLENIDDFLLISKQPKLVVNSKSAPNLEAFNSYLISETESNSMITSLQLLKDTVNRRGRFLVILKTNCSETVLKNVFQKMWNFYISNVVIYTNLRFVTWYPYHEENQCGNVVNLVTVKSENPYEKKINIGSNCPMSVTWEKVALGIKSPFNKKDPGYFIRILETVLQKVNTTPIYLSQNINYFTLALIKGHYSDLKDDMLKRNIDMAIISLDTTNLGVPLMECSDFLWQYTLFFVLPPRSRTKTENLIQKLILSMAFLYFMNLNWIYISQLSGILSQPSYEPKIWTINDLIRSTKTVKFPDGYIPAFKRGGFYNDLFKKRLQEKAKSYEEQVQDFAKKPDHGITSSTNRIYFIKNKEKLQIVSRQNIAVFKNHVLVRKGYPLLDKINQVIIRVRESGLISKWIYESQINIDKTTVVFEELSNSLDMSRLVCAFVLLGVGILISVVVIILEVVYANYN
ncbi:hypothetical protein Zmor_018048 [Zophobas morio]|uniref:Uncharacterized protein n=1 Tax=Zophobas morio TaxID=2755281 RepID=A0AA38IDG0_9CUCU|nr:hypothetical protein Zmor_018048 [Zophobas morio]